MNAPIVPRRTVIPGRREHILLRRVMKIRSDVGDIERIMLVEHHDLRITLRDTGPGDISAEVAAGDTAIHLLWAMDDESASLAVEDVATPLAPGDLIVLPAGTAWRASQGLILCEIAGTAADRRRVGGPTHGTEIFHGYNRETTFPAPPGLAISRWKITQPHEAPTANHGRYVINLTTPVALSWPTGTDLIGPGECRHIPPSTGPVTFLPDGLGYVLIVDLMHRVPTG